MPFLKMIVKSLLMPPGIFIILLIVSGIWFFLKKRWTPGLVNCIIGISLWLVSISPVSNLLMKGLESGFAIPREPGGDVIILLGGGINACAADMSGIGAPSEEMSTRTITAVRLQRRLGLPIIVSAGTTAGLGVPEAIIVGRFLTDIGVPDNKIILEVKSRNTFENAKYSLEICKNKGFKKPILVTSAYHLKRSVYSFEKVGLDVIPFPAGFKGWPCVHFEWKDLLCLPSAESFMTTYDAFNEYLGLLFYRMAY